MAGDEHRAGIKYEPVIGEGKHETTHKCVIRSDDHGILNHCKAWYLPFIHIAACVALLVCIEQLVNDHDFQTGSPPSFFAHPLYQAQITGLISLSLVLIKFIGGACSALLVWRTVYIILDREGLTLAEVMRMIKFRVPIVHRTPSKNWLLWSVWVALVVTFLWPAEFASPLATSAVVWIPSTRLASKPTSIPTQSVDGSADWGFLFYPELRFKALLSAVFMAGEDPGYAFNSQEMSLRRYLSSEQAIPSGSFLDITVPYFEAELQWVDASDELRFQHVGDSRFYDVANLDVNSRSNGSVAILRNDTSVTFNSTPQAAEIYSGTKIVTIKVNTLNVNMSLSDGTIVDQNTTCPTTSSSLGQLPNVTQHEESFYGSGTSIWLGKDCFLIAEAAITAGKYQGKNCESGSAGKSAYAATCVMPNSTDAVEADWLSETTVEFLSEMMQYIVMVDLTSQWMPNNLEGYTTGMLRLAHHAIWSSLTDKMGKSQETATATLAETVIRAEVDRTKMLTWLIMCGTLTVSAVLVAIGQSYSSVKAVRNATLAALLLDTSEIAHESRTTGLCSAVKLNKEDKKLPRLTFAGDNDRQLSEKCRRRLVFAEGKMSEV